MTKDIMKLVHAFSGAVCDYVASDYVSASHAAGLQARAEDARAAVVAALEQLTKDVLEQAAQAATDAVAFNGGTVQMEAHVREAIRKMIGEI